MHRLPRSMAALGMDVGGEDNRTRLNLWKIGRYAAVGRRTDATNQLHAMLLFAVGVRAAGINRYVF